MFPAWLETIVFGHSGAALENGQKTGLPKTGTAEGFWVNWNAVRFSSALHQQEAACFKMFASPSVSF